MSKLVRQRKNKKKGRKEHWSRCMSSWEGEEVNSLTYVFRHKIDHPIFTFTSYAWNSAQLFSLPILHRPSEACCHFSAMLTLSILFTIKMRPCHIMKFRSQLTCGIIILHLGLVDSREGDFRESSLLELTQATALSLMLSLPWAAIPQLLVHEGPGDTAQAFFLNLYQLSFYCAFLSDQVMNSLKN